MLRFDSYVLLDSDYDKPLKSIGEGEIVITYGLNSKSTITVSSITEDEITLCVQREFKNINDKKVIPQEIPMSIKEKNSNISEILCEAALSLILERF
ncbi:MAG: hypothetical protein LBL34_03140 [Clostridiales bacterium]|jgi:hypothetical protein|nr:hypothetical protein [Clostridiales bacterium]